MEENSTNLPETVQTGSMKKVILTRGLPASGKSTWAKQVVAFNPNSYKRVNKDELRAMLDNSKWSKDSEKFILDVRDQIILSALEKGKHVIVDDTNFSDKHVNRISQLVKGLAEIEIVDFTDVSVEECISRDLKRANPVGEKVIRRMYNEHIYKPEIYNENKLLPHAIIVDIDGTLAKMNGRSPYDWDKVKTDTVNETIKQLSNNYPDSVLIFSGRDGSCKDLTIEWLNENGVEFSDIFMREAGNNEKDSVIKKRLFEENVRGKYYIDFVLDDRLQVCRMWHSLGLTLLRVGNPDADF